MHVPKTIDNDLGAPITAQGSARREVRGPGVCRREPGQPRPARRVHRRGHGTARGLSHRSLGIRAQVSRRRPTPHLCARTPFNPERFINDVQASYDKHGRCIIAVSEGVCGANGQPKMTSLKGSRKGCARQRATFGNRRAGRSVGRPHQGQDQDQASARRYPGLSAAVFLGCVSATDASEAREVGERPCTCSLAQRGRSWPFARGRLRGRVRSAEADRRGGRDQAHGRRVHRPGGQRCHRCVQGLRAAPGGESPVLGRIAAPSVFKIKGE